MNVSTATLSVVGSIIEAAHVPQAGSNGHDTSLTTGAAITTLDHSHLVTIEVDLDQRHDGRHRRQEKPFWKGFVEEYEDPAGYVAVAFVRASDDGTASRSSVIKQLMGVAGRRGYRLDGFEDRTTGDRIQGKAFSTLSNLEPQMTYD